MHTYMRLRVSLRICVRNAPARPRLDVRLALPPPCNVSWAGAPRGSRDAFPSSSHLCPDAAPAAPGVRLAPAWALWLPRSPLLTMLHVHFSSPPIVGLHRMFHGPRGLHATPTAIGAPESEGRSSAFPPSLLSPNRSLVSTVRQLQRFITAAVSPRGGRACHWRRRARPRFRGLASPPRVTGTWTSWGEGGGKGLGRYFGEPRGAGSTWRRLGKGPGRLGCGKRKRAKGEWEALPPASRRRSRPPRHLHFFHRPACMPLLSPRARGLVPAVGLPARPGSGSAAASAPALALAPRATVRGSSALIDS